MSNPTEPVTVAVVQLCSRDDLSHNLERARALVMRAAARGAALVVLPENTTFMGAEEQKRATAEDFALGAEGPDAGPVRRWLGTLARDSGASVLLGGVPERVSGEARVYNTALLADPGGAVTARYRKIHLFDVQLDDGTLHRESAAVAPGEELVVAESPVGPLGLSICYDVRFPELYRGLVSRGAVALAVPAAFTLTTGRDHWHLLLRARAVENQCYVLAAAQWGNNGPGRQTYGHALVCDPWGTVLAECADGEGYALAEVDPGRLRSVRRQLPALQHRREGLR